MKINTPNLSITNIHDILDYHEASSYLLPQNDWKSLLGIAATYCQILEDYVTIHLSDDEAFYYNNDILLCSTWDKHTHHFFCSDILPFTPVTDCLRFAIFRLQYCTYEYFDEKSNIIYNESGIKISRKEIILT